MIRIVLRRSKMQWRWPSRPQQRKSHTIPVNLGGRKGSDRCRRIRRSRRSRAAKYLADNFKTTQCGERPMPQFNFTCAKVGKKELLCVSELPDLEEAKE